MDAESDINLSIGEALRSEVMVAATVEAGKINVKKLNITNIYEEKNYSADVFPNPASGTIQLKFETFDDTRTLVITDLTGQVLRQTYLNAALSEISIEDLQAGIYLFKVIEKGIVVKTVKVAVE